MIADEVEFGLWVAALRALLAERKAKAANLAAGDLKRQADAAAAAIAAVSAGGPPVAPHQPPPPPPPPHAEQLAPLPAQWPAPPPT